MNQTPPAGGLGNFQKLRRQLKDEPATADGKGHGEDETTEAEPEHTGAEQTNLRSEPPQADS